MRFILTIIAGAISIYSLLIIIRIIISWFGSLAYGKPVEILARITDPYLDWWRRNFKLNVGFLDFSAVAGIVFLSLIQNILYTIIYSDNLTIGYILAQILLAVWSIVSFILGFFIIVLILRLVAYLINSNMYNPFWQFVDNVSRPILYRINRIIFGNRITGYFRGIIVPIIVLVAIWIAAGYLVPMLAVLLANL